MRVFYSFRRGQSLASLTAVFVLTISGFVRPATAQSGIPQGGHWSVSYRVDGEAQGHYRNGQSNANQINIQPWWNSNNRSNVFPNQIPLRGSYPLGASAVSSPNSSGGYASVSARAEGTISIVFDWTPSPFGPPTPAPVPRILSFVVRAVMHAEGGGQSPVTLQATTGLPNESVVTTGPTRRGTTEPPDYYSTRVATAMVPVVLETGGQSHIEWTSPNLFSKVSISAYVPTQSVRGMGGQGAVYPEEFVWEPFSVVSPNPGGLALAPCPDPTPQPPLNQYVINGGGQGVFVVPVVLRYGGTNVTFLDQLCSGLAWTIERAPSEMAPRASVPTGTSTNGTSTDLFPQHLPFAVPTPQPVPAPNQTPTPAPPPPPVPGLAFRNVLPTQDDAASVFGSNSITHTFQGQTIATSPFALFYNSTATTHPYGGPKGYFYGSTGTWAEIDTPNWFYYYDQAWKNSSGFEIRYLKNSTTSNSKYYNGDSFVWVGDDAHGLKGTNTYLFGRIRAANGTLGPLQVVGLRQLKGIDTYAAIINHECTHKLCWEYINNGGYADADGDQVPDDWEVQAGLDPTDTDTADWTSNPTVAGEFGTAYSASQGDDEVFARMHERAITPNPDIDQDWADDGLNFGRPPTGAGTPSRCRRYVDYPETGVNADFSNVEWPSLP